MAQLTKAQLVAQLERAHVAYQALVTERDSLKAELATRPAAARTSSRPAYQSNYAPTPEQLARRAAMAEAKAKAIATGRCIPAF